MYKLYYYILLIIAANSHNSTAYQDFYWRDYNPGVIPSDALEAAKGRYIGQAYDLGFIPGTIYPYKGILVIEQNSKKVHRINIKILCTQYPERFYWKQVSYYNLPGHQMDGAVKGGYQGNDNLYIGRAFTEGEWKIGRVTSATSNIRGLYVWRFDGKESRFTEFEVLKYNYTTVPKNDTEACNH